MVALALLPLPEESDLFKEALASTNNLDELDLGQWDHDPPYFVTPGAQDTPSEVRWTRLLEEVMHGRRLRQQREVDEERQKYYRGKSVDGLQAELEQVIDKHWMEYDRLKRILSTYEGGSHGKTSLTVEGSNRVLHYPTT